MSAAVMTGSPLKQPSKPRAFGAFVIFLIAALLVPMGIVGTWASRTVADTDRYVETVTALIDSPEVRAEVGTQLTNILFDALPTGEIAKSVLPNGGQALSGIVTQAAKSALQTAVTNALATPQARQVWAGINRQLQSNLIAALKGDSNSVFQVQGDALILDTRVLIAKVQELLVNQGLTVFSKISIPQAGNRQIVLVRDAQIRTISTTYRVAQPLANGLIWAALILLGLGIFVINRRRVGVLISGWIFLLTGLFFVLTVNVAKSLALSGLAVPETSWQAVTAETLIRYLPGLGRTCIAIGVVAIAAAVIAGSTTLAVWMRKVFMSGAALTGRELSRVKQISAQAGTVSKQLGKIAIVILALAAIGLYTSDTVSAGRVAWVSVLSVLAWFVAHALAASGASALGGSEPQAVRASDEAATQEGDPVLG